MKTSPYKTCAFCHGQGHLSADFEDCRITVDGVPYIMNKAKIICWVCDGRTWVMKEIG